MMRAIRETRIAPERAAISSLAGVALRRYFLISRSSGRIAVTPRFGESTTCAILRSTTTLRERVGLVAREAALAHHPVDHLEQRVPRRLHQIVREIRKSLHLRRFEVAEARRHFAARPQPSMKQGIRSVVPTIM